MIASAAANNADSFSVSWKHLAGARGGWSKFAPSVNPNDALREALQADNAQFGINDITSFRVTTNLGRVVGSRGETSIRAIVDFNGQVVTWFPVQP
jgi:hypothetical protein